jgi:hypothetical protein
MQRHGRHGRPPPAGFTFSRRGIAVRAGTTGEVFLVGYFLVGCFLVGCSPAWTPDPSRGVLCVSGRQLRR